MEKMKITVSSIDEYGLAQFTLHLGDTHYGHDLTGRIGVRFLTNYELDYEQNLMPGSRREIEKFVRIYVLNRYSKYIEFGTKLTHEEFNVYVKSCAKRFCDDPFYTAKDLEHDYNKICIIPFNLEQYELPELYVNVINQNFMEHRQQKKSVLFFGKYPTDKAHLIAFQLDCEPITNINFKSQSYYVNRVFKMIFFFYGESEIRLEIYNDDKAFEKDIKLMKEGI